MAKRKSKNIWDYYDENFQEEVSKVNNDKKQKKGSLYGDLIPFHIVMILSVVMMLGFFLEYQFNYNKNYSKYAEDIGSLDFKYEYVTLNAKDKQTIGKLSVEELLLSGSQLTEKFKNKGNVLYVSEIKEEVQKKLDESKIDKKDLNREDIKIGKYILKSNKAIKDEKNFSTVYTLKSDEDIYFKVNDKLTGFFTETKHVDKKYGYYTGISIHVSNYFNNVHFIPLYDYSKGVIEEDITINKSYIMDNKPNFYKYLIGHMKDDVYFGIVLNFLLVYYIIFIINTTVMLVNTDNPMSNSFEKDFTMQTKFNYISYKYFTYLYKTAFPKVFSSLVPLILMTFILSQIDLLYIGLIIPNGYTIYEYVIPIIYGILIIRFFRDIYSYYPTRKEHIKNFYLFMKSYNLLDSAKETIKKENK